MTDAAPFAFAGIAELRAAYRSGTATPLQVVEAAIRRSEALEPRLNAVIDVMHAPALAAADVATREFAAGIDRGPLQGIPVAVKDLIDVAGVPTSYASKAVDPVVPAGDAPLVRRLRQAGAVPLFKTNLLEFAYGIVHPAFGQTNNPWDPTRTSGGSSGGSAAVVAAGIVPVAVGTDTGGSIRIPAAYCGIVGLKPSYGLVSTDGVFPLSWSLDHVGPLARSVRDAASLLSGLTGLSMPIAERPVDGLRIGLITAHLDSPLVSPGVRGAVSDALDKLRRQGARFYDIAVPELDAVKQGLMAVLLAEAALIHERIYADRPDGYAPQTRIQIEAGAAVTGIDYVRGQRLRIRLTSAVESLFERVDVLLSPAVAFVAPTEDPVMDGEGGDGEGLSSGFANMTGHPALSMPCGLSEGLPVGIQLVGSIGRDADLLSAAAAIEACLAFSHTPVL